MHSLTSFTKKIHNPFKKLGTSPEYDWRFALWCFIIALILSLAIDGYFFKKLSAPVDQNASNGDLKSITLNKQEISETVENIKKKDLDSAQIPDAMKNDPSI